MTERLTLRRPDDWHLHLRDGAMLRAVAPESARHFARAIIMPNLVPPVVRGDDASAYRDRILAALPEGARFEPLMTLYLTEDTDPEDVAQAHADGLITAVKLYPAGATTNSASGVRDFDRVRPVLERMAEIGLPLCVHGEVTDAEVDIFDREHVFIDRVLDPIRRDTPGLRVVMEHITTREGVEYVRAGGADIGGTITAHHLVINRNDLLVGGIRPHYYCLPVAKREIHRRALRVVMEHITTREGVEYVRAGGADIGGTITAHHLVINRNDLLVGGIRPHYYCLPVAKREIHRRALRAAAMEGQSRFFLGTDSAPHPDTAKETACGCAGCFTATNALPLLAEVFEQDGALDNLEAFTSLNGPDFYRLPRNEGTVSLEKGAPQDPPGKIAADGEDVTVFDPGFPLHWRVTD